MLPADHHRAERVGTAVAARAHELDTARSRLLEARRPGGRTEDQRLLQSDLCAALEAYAAALATLGAPLPYRLRTELDLYRNLTQLSRRG